ncbi:MAG TPA: IPT/TIG domain-containing protein [Acidobacteriota bacterium]|nr:IPT/TIG domain-containing protein [Acidobacteriota bacterium]
MLIFVVLIVVLLSFWPETTGTQLTNQTVTLFGLPLGAVGLEVRLFVLVLVAGALGSFIHVATSAGDYIGNRKLYRSWIYWYILRLPVGASLALLVYLLLRGGVITGTGVSEVPQTAPFGIVGLSALAGMFAKKATNKLGEIFDMLFHTDQDDKLKDKVGAQAPVLTALDPSSLKVGSTQLELRITGQHFGEDTKVLIDGEARAAEYVSDTQLSLSLKKEDVAQAGVLKVQLENPSVRDKSDTMELSIEDDTE